MIEAGLESINSSLMDYMNSKGPKNIQNMIDRIIEDEYFHKIKIFDKNREILYSSNRNEVGQHITSVSPRYRKTLVPSIVLLEDRGIYAAYKPIVNKQMCQSCHDTKEKILAYLDVEMQLTYAEKSFYTGTSYIILLAIALALLLFFSLLIIFNKLINKPLFQLITAFNEVENGNFDVHLDDKKVDEFGVMNNHFNRMVHNLKTSQREIKELYFEQLQHADKLATLGELTAEIAHEINNPTAIILARADYLSGEVGGNPDLKKYSKDLNAILEQTERISRITKNILRYGRKLPQNFQKIQISEVLKQSLHIIEPRLKKKQIQVEENFKDQNTYVFADPTQLEQIAINLIHNAIDASEYSDKIILKVYLNSENKVVMEVKDYGIGMDEETLKKVFSPFFTTKSEKKGTGLGLFIVKNICDNHNAEIKCESSLGKGVLFKILFNEYLGKE
ncbi:MAG: ATP-binding protein [Melioribacteraceae bacterium]|nr:ATP-binding protein [Melioribacteraceae bacterium]